MPTKSLYIAAALLTAATLSAAVAHADHDSEKRKIYNKYEIVSFGETQSFIQTWGRILEGAGEWFGANHDDKSVYEKRFETLKFHWDDVRKKFKDNGVDTKKEPIYFGMIEWTPKDSLTGLPQDHKIQFYVAARKKKGKGSRPDLTEPVEAPQGVRKARPNQRWRFVDTPTRGEYIIEWYDPEAGNWGDKALSADATGNVEVSSLKKKSPAQRWLLVSAGRESCLIVSEATKQVLDYHGKGDRKFRADTTSKVGDNGRYGQLWLVVETPTEGELGLWNPHAKRYLGYNTQTGVVECQE